MFDPKFQITPKIAKTLMQIEALKHSLISLPITPSLLMHLRETANITINSFNHD